MVRTDTHLQWVGSDQRHAHSVKACAALEGSLPPHGSGRYDQRSCTAPRGTLMRQAASPGLGHRTTVTRKRPSCPRNDRLYENYTSQHAGLEDSASQARGC